MINALHQARPDAAKTKACHWDPTLRQRVTDEHLDGCPNPASHRGCKPCPERHCEMCSRTHLTDSQPHTCDTCVGEARTDLQKIGTCVALLRHTAAHGTNDSGRLNAASPIPGGDALVLIGPFVELQRLTVDVDEDDEDHRPGDPIPPGAITAEWERIWRSWFAHQAPQLMTRASGWVSPLDRQISYFGQILTDVARTGPGSSPDSTPPDAVVFFRQLRRLRARLEQAIHDEAAPELGIECMECGHRLVRQWRTARRCGCGDRPVLEHLARELDLPSYPHRIDPDVACCIACYRETRWDTQHAKHNQGGLDSAEPGEAWECTHCRTTYDKIRYARAVRSSIVTGRKDGDAWVSLHVAADAARDISGRAVTPARIRDWIARTYQREANWVVDENGPLPIADDVIASCCAYDPGPPPDGAPACVWSIVPAAPAYPERIGTRLVWWEDVLTRALDIRQPGRKRRPNGPGLA